MTWLKGRLRRALGLYSPSQAYIFSFAEYQRQLDEQLRLADAHRRQSEAERAEVAKAITTPLQSGVL